MAVPKKKTSVSRKGLRRAGQHHKLYANETSNCSNCGELIKPHCVCSACGNYKGKEVFTIRVREDKEEEQLPIN